MKRIKGKELNTKNNDCYLYEQRNHTYISNTEVILISNCKFK